MRKAACLQVEVELSQLRRRSERPSQQVREHAVKLLSGSLLGMTPRRTGQILL